MVPQVCIDQID